MCSCHFMTVTENLPGLDTPQRRHMGPIQDDSDLCPPTEYAAKNAPVAELARVPTSAYYALNSGEFGYEW